MMAVSTPSARRCIITAWLIAGSLDIITASVYFSIRTGKDPLRVLYFIASGVFGNTALTGGVVYGVWGLLLHYLIAFLFTVFFFRMYPRWKFLSFNKWITALMYGLFVWVVMNRLVLPLSNTPQSPFRFDQAVIAAVILIVMIGLPFSIIIGKYYTSKQSVS